MAEDECIVKENGTNYPIKDKSIRNFERQVSGRAEIVSLCIGEVCV